jgi:hypothetical protein
MGKKSRKVSKQPASAAVRVAATAPATSLAAAAYPLTYPSDGPSEEELNCLQSSSATLQAKLDQLTSLALVDDRSGFVQNFVPLDLSADDANAYLQDLTTAPEAASQWTNLASEIAALAAGKNVHKIEGDQVSKAVFFFTHPLLPSCDREVSFVCTRGEWRAEG